jgi:hypothetical protein
MRHRITRHTRILLTTLTTTIILAANITTATAQRLSNSNQQIRIVWTALELGNTISTNVVRCAVTLEGSLHSRTIPKVRELLIGYITRANIQNNQCTGGRATLRQEKLPWHLTYQSFRGTLPRITEILLNLIRLGFDIEIPGVNNCAATTSVANPARGIAVLSTTNGQVTGLNADPNATIPLTNAPGGFACGLGSGRFTGTGAMRLLGTNCLIFITLI